MWLIRHSHKNFNEHFNRQYHSAFEWIHIAVKEMRTKKGKQILFWHRSGSIRMRKVLFLILIYHIELWDSSITYDRMHRWKIANFAKLYFKTCDSRWAKNAHMTKKFRVRRLFQFTRKAYVLFMKTVIAACVSPSRHIHKSQYRIQVNTNICCSIEMGLRCRRCTAVISTVRNSRSINCNIIWEYIFKQTEIYFETFRMRKDKKLHLKCI